MITGLIAASFSLLALAFLIQPLLGIERRIYRQIPAALTGAASTLLAVAGGASMNRERPVVMSLGGFLEIGRQALVIDHLSGMFLVLVSVIAVAVSACYISYAGSHGLQHSRWSGSLYALLIASVTSVLLAGDVFVFLFAWEILSLSFYGLVAVGASSPSLVRSVGTIRSSADSFHHREDRILARKGFASQVARDPEASWITLGASKIGGASLLLGLLLAAVHAGSMSFAMWHGLGHGDIQQVVWALLVVGFGAKIGLVPFEAWMPRGYVAATGLSRAAMAGIAVNVGFYGFWRFLGLLGYPPAWLDVIVLVLGALTAIGGIAFATVQSDLGRVLAYSSVENSGIIITAFGVALTGATTNEVPLVAVGLLAATSQVVAHALGKSLTFAATAHLELASGSLSLDDMKGLGHQVPYVRAAFAVGAASLAGLPPSIGFVSEWFVLEALMQQFRVHDLPLRLALATAGAAVALTVGFAALAFLRILGLTILGKGKRAAYASGGEGVASRWGLGVLALGCLGLAAITPWEFRFIARGLSQLVPVNVVQQALRSPFVLQPVFSGFSILSPSWLWITMPLLLVVVVLAALLLSGGRYISVRKVRPWRSATLERSESFSYTSFAFANPARHILANILGARKQVSQIDLAPFDEAELGESTVPVWTFYSRTVHEHTVTDPVVRYLLQPVRKMLLFISKQAKCLQSGKLALYITYMLIALLGLLAVVASLR
ncbi:MAG: hypothetical protein M1519_05235 [Actinobacteria bacterium]|jgi:formate hydrogenlyase subunit 3/multisubunit Na+/H+ antiporter MnhD subunit|nr:hypothetical protein [Actinomycetota bacterium]